MLDESSLYALYKKVSVVITDKGGNYRKLLKHFPVEAHVIFHPDNRLRLSIESYLLYAMQY